MPNARFKNLEEADQSLKGFEETYAGDKGKSALTTATALMPIFAAVRLLIEEVQKLKANSN